MNGLVIWAYAECRSVMATYRAVMQKSNCPCLLVLLRGARNQENLRARTGFRSDEFADVPREYIGLDFCKGQQIVKAHPGWNHLFSDYQGSSLVRRLIQMARAQGSRVGIINEAPCNMAAGWRWFVKELFLRTMLPCKVRKTVQCADFLANCSGDDDKAIRFAAWPQDKIIPFGYYPPPIEGSQCIVRDTNKPFRILATGILSRYRGCDCLVEALRILKEWGIRYEATITQEGELLPELKRRAEKYSLPIEFTGFVSLSRLISLYETCSVYVGTGRDEPWGMRLNDALNCGAPLVVSSGMGGRKLVDDMECGLVYPRQDAHALASCLRKLATDDARYLACAKCAAHARKTISPEAKAQDLVTCWRKIEGWS